MDRNMVGGTVSKFMEHAMQRLINVSPDDAARIAFWERLCKLGASNMKEQRPEAVEDIDDTVHLTAAEWTVLDAEIDELCQQAHV